MSLWLAWPNGVFVTLSGHEQAVTLRNAFCLITSGSPLASHLHLQRRFFLIFLTPLYYFLCSVILSGKGYSPFFFPPLEFLF